MRKLKYSIFLLLAPVLLSCFGGRPIPTIVLPGIQTIVNQIEPIDVDYYLQKYDGESAVSLSLDLTLEHLWTGAKNISFSSNQNWYVHKVRRDKYVILNPEDDEYTIFKATGNMNSFYLLVSNPGGEIRTYGVEDLTVKKANDGLKNYSFIIPDVQKGCLIDVGYDIDLPRYSATQGTIILQNEKPVEKLHFEFHCPDWWKILVKKIAPGESLDYRVETIDSLNRQEIKYTAYDVPPARWEPFSLSIYEFTKYFKYDVVNLKMGMINDSTPSSWEGIGEEIRRTFNGKLERWKSRRKFTELAYELAYDYDSDIDLIRKLLKYMHDNIEYDKTAYFNFTYEDVLKHKKANLIDYVGATRELLTSAGIETDIMVAHSVESGFFDRDFISFDEIDVLGLIVRADGRDLVILPYKMSYPITYVPEIIQGQPALRIGDGSGVKLIELPNGDNEISNYDEVFNITIDETGMMQVTESLQIDGLKAYEVLKRMENTEEVDLGDKLKSMTPFDASEIELDDYNIVVSEYDYSLFEVEMQYSFDNTVTVMPDEVIMRIDRLLQPVSGMTADLDSLHRHNPIKIFKNTRFTKNITINYPEKWSAVDSLSNFDNSYLFGSHIGKITYQPGKIIITQTLDLKKSRQPKNKIGELVRMLSGDKGFDISHFIFRR